MLDLFLIIILIISLAKPDILLAKKVKEKASDEQKQILVKNYRKIYAILIALFESLAIMRYSSIIGGVLAIIFIILFFTISWPATKQNKQILKELEKILNLLFYNRRFNIFSEYTFLLSAFFTRC